MATFTVKEKYNQLFISVDLEMDYDGGEDDAGTFLCILTIVAIQNGFHYEIHEKK